MMHTVLNMFAGILNCFQWGHKSQPIFVQFENVDQQLITRLKVIIDGKNFSSLKLLRTGSSIRDCTNYTQHIGRC